MYLVTALLLNLFLLRVVFWIVVHGHKDCFVDWQWKRFWHHSTKSTWLQMKAVASFTEETVELNQFRDLWLEFWSPIFKTANLNTEVFKSYLLTELCCVSLVSTTCSPRHKMMASNINPTYRGVVMISALVIPDENNSRIKILSKLEFSGR